MGLPGLPVGDITDLWSETVVTDTLSGGELGGGWAWSSWRGTGERGLTNPH